MVEVVRAQRARHDGSTYKHAYFRGLVRCGSVWECPACAQRIRAERAAELKRAADVWGPDCIVMLSLTVRHGLDDGLRAVRRGLAGSFRRLINGMPWKRFCERWKLRHHVRAIEVTHGEHGWHPHLHVLFFLDRKLAEEGLAEASAWLRQRWALCVRRTLGVSFVPNEHGVDLRESKRVDYLAKLSFELTDPGTKRGRGKNRSPLQIAVDAASGRREADGPLWRAYCDGMRGAKMLTWSRGLREAVELDDEASASEISQAEDSQDAEPIAIITNAAWEKIRSRRGMACAVLEAAELAPSQADAAKTIQALIWGATPSRAPP